MDKNKSQKEKEDIKFLKIGLKSADNKKYHNNFIASTLHCLSNINFLSSFIINLFIINTNKKTFKNELFEKYKELLIKLKALNDKDDNEKCSLKEFEDFLFNKEEYKDINNYNPKFLLNNLITELNLYISSEFNDSFIADNFFIKVQIINRCLNCRGKIFSF